MSTYGDLKGKRAVVTGARTGIGAAIAIKLAQLGADIVAVGDKEMPETRSAVEACGVKFFRIKADLCEQATREGCERIIDEACKLMGGVDILINNAGRIFRADSVDVSDEDWDNILNINLKAVFFLSRAVADRLIKEGRGGKIVNISSLLAYQGGLRVVSYSASKSGISGVTKACANEWAKLGINVNAIAPGYIATDLNVALRNDPERYDAITSRIPAGNWGKPEDIAGTAAFLCSDDAKYIHGFTIAVDGGWLGR
ncbi:MAG: 2-dehydro-3-deoxy-D-gluconate 5-dehydrogenase KduD [Clostridia bacterium]|nr:2-dehydro-3-deoxy-D-gluconate 5-dehydrogenase KduD [Clostridia bacterium]